MSTGIGNATGAPARRPAPRPSQLLPAALYGPARRRLTPAMAGRSDTRHVALTFDDGPDPRSTPEFLELLARHRTTATFFLVGERAERHPDVVRLIVEAGHELGVHGWLHRCVAGLPPAVLAGHVARSHQLLDDLGQTRVRWYRPPYGVTTLSSTRAATASGLRPVLWTAWGRDWARAATPAGISRTVSRTLRPGGTVLLHDTDAYSAPGSWRRTLEAADRLLDQWHDRGWPVGPLRDHGLVPEPAGRGDSAT